MSTTTNSGTAADASVVGEAHQLPVDEVLDAHHTSKSGLSSEAARERLGTVGRNELETFLPLRDWTSHLEDGRT